MHPIFLGKEATWDLAWGEVPPELAPGAQAFPPDEPTHAIDQDALEPVDYRLLHLRFIGLSDEALAEAVGRALAEVRARIRRPRFLAVQADVEKGVLQQIIRQGEYEPTTVAKAAAPDAMRRIVAQGEKERDPRTKLAANKAILQYAGIEPPKRLEITTPDRVIEQMTAQELEDLAERRVWPARFREVLRAFLPGPVPAQAPRMRERKPPAETVVEVTPEPAPEGATDLTAFADELGLSKS